MNILLLTSEFAPARGGIATYAREIATAAARLGAQVTVSAPDYGGEHAPPDDSGFPFRTMRFRGGLHSMRHLPAKITHARRQIRAEPYDVVHAADWPFFLPVALARRRTRARMLMTVHGTEINEMQTAAKRLAVRLAGVFRPEVEVIANSAFTRGLFGTRFPDAAARVRAVGLGASAFWLAGAAPRQATRRALALPSAAVVIVTVARLTRRKGHLLALAALAELPARLRNRVVWLVVGPDGETDHVNTLKSAASAADCDVRFLGALADEQVRDIYAAADLFCLTGQEDSSGRVEGFGLVYLEAAACGLPSVATAVGGVAEAVIANRTGLVVAPAREPIVQAIAALAEDAELRARLGQQALAHARRLSWEACAAATYGLHPGVDTTPAVTPAMAAEPLTAQPEMLADGRL